MGCERLSDGDAGYPGQSSLLSFEMTALSFQLRSRMVSHSTRAFHKTYRRAETSEAPTPVGDLPGLALFANFQNSHVSGGRQQCICDYCLDMNHLFQMTKYASRSIQDLLPTVPVPRSTSTTTRPQMCSVKRCSAAAKAFPRMSGTKAAPNASNVCCWQAPRVHWVSSTSNAQHWRHGVSF